MFMFTLSVICFSHFSSAEMFPMLSTIAGNGTVGNSGTGGSASAMTLNYAEGIWGDSMGVIYVSESAGNCIRKFAYPNGIVSNVAGVCGYHYNYGGDDGPATSALLFYPRDVVGDNIGQIYIADYYNYRIRKVSTSGIISTIAGNGVSYFFTITTAATSSTFAYPYGLWIDSISQLYVSIDYDSTVRKIDTNTGYHTLIAGVAFFLYSGDGGPATSAGLSCNGISGDDSGGVYFSDWFSNRIRFINSNGIISTAIGTGINGYNGEDVAATSCNLGFLNDVLWNSLNGDVFISNGNRIQRMDNVPRTMSTVAGDGEVAFNAKEEGLATNVSVDAIFLYMTTDQVLLFTDYNNVIRQVQFGPSDSDDDAISDSSDSSHSSSSSAALSFGGIVGIVIAVAVIVGCIVAVWKSKPSHSHAAVVVPVAPLKQKESELVATAKNHSKATNKMGKAYALMNEKV